MAAFHCASQSTRDAPSHPPLHSVEGTDQWRAKIVRNEIGCMNGPRTRGSCCFPRTVYVLEVSSNKGVTWTVRKHYQDFHDLYMCLVTTVPEFLRTGPSLPGKWSVHARGKASKRARLQCFLDCVLRMQSSDAQRCSAEFLEERKAATKPVPATPTCTVTICNLRGEVLELQPFISATFVEVQETIKECWGVAPGLQRLLYGCRELLASGLEECLEDVVGEFDEDGGEGVVALTLLKTQGVTISLPAASDAVTRSLRRLEPPLEPGLGLYGYHKFSDGSFAYRQFDGKKDHVLVWRSERWELLHNKSSVLVMHSAPGDGDETAGPASVQEWIYDAIWDRLDQGPCSPTPIDIDVHQA